MSKISLVQYVTADNRFALIGFMLVLFVGAGYELWTGFEAGFDLWTTARALIYGSGATFFAIGLWRGRYSTYLTMLFGQALLIAMGSVVFSIAYFIGMILVLVMHLSERRKQID